MYAYLRLADYALAGWLASPFLSRGFDTHGHET